MVDGLEVVGVVVGSVVVAGGVDFSIAVSFLGIISRMRRSTTAVSIIPRTAVFRLMLEPSLLNQASLL